MRSIFCFFHLLFLGFAGGLPLLLKIIIEVQIYHPAFLLPTKLRRDSTDPVTSTPVIRIKLNSGNFVSVKNYRGLHLNMRFWLSEKNRLS